MFVDISETTLFEFEFIDEQLLKKCCGLCGNFVIGRMQKMKYNCIFKLHQRPIKFPKKQMDNERVEKYKWQYHTPNN